MRKGIVLAGGSGTRLYPVTKAVSKQLLPIYDKPMIYYSLSVLLLSGIRDILIISNPEFIDLYKRLFEDGSFIGVSVKYKVQEKPRGIAEAFIIGEDFIGGDNVCLVLGDNIFFGQGFSVMLEKANSLDGATVFGYFVKDPSAYGVIEVDKDGKPLSIEEKPQKPRSHYAIPGLYFYDNDVVNIAKSLKPSARGELEITDVNKVYLERGKLNVLLFGRGFAWFDAGTHDGLLEASNFIETIQKRQSMYVGCIEEIAYRKGFINREQLVDLAKRLEKTNYGKYLLEIANENIL
ncbi:MAG: glucose-1-phosphate thymidylyltransferase RfbA [Brevinematales bacterium]|nr:glucose-1-phosphate thymidylyltransferase RfbA [Brevinematales bacterium]